MEAATLAVLECMFAAAEAVPPASHSAEHAAAAAQDSIAFRDTAAAAPQWHCTAADGICHVAKEQPDSMPTEIVAASHDPSLADKAKAATTAEAAAQSAGVALRGTDDTVDMVAVHLLVSHFTAGLLVGTAAGSGTAAGIRAVPGLHAVSGVLPMK